MVVGPLGKVDDNEWKLRLPDGPAKGIVLIRAKRTHNPLHRMSPQVRSRPSQSSLAQIRIFLIDDRR